MDPKLLLVKIVTLLYKESLFKDVPTQSATIAKAVISTIKFPETGMDFDTSRDSMHSLRATALWMCENPPDYQYDRGVLLQRIRVNSGDDEGLYYAFEQGIREEADEVTLKRQCLQARHELRSFLDELVAKDILKKAYYKSQFASPDGRLDIRALVRQVSTDLEQFLGPRADEQVEGMVEEVDVGDMTAMSNLLERAQAETAAEGIIKTGWQGLNRMTGEHGGFRRGEMIVVGALQHQFKTGFTLSIFKQAALYNTPWMRDPTKKPLLLHISTENDLQINMLWLYSNIKENETGEEVDLNYFKVEDEEEKKRRFSEAVRYVHERMSATGYHVRMVRMNPSDTTVHSLFEKILELEAEGYEIHLIVCDYLNMISKKGCTVGGPSGEDIRDLYRRVRNFTSPKGITFITPHQLSSDAKSLVRGGVENFVQEIANKGYYDGCKRVDQEVDMEIYIHIVKVNGASYLTMQRGKHRKVKITPDRHLHCVLPFSPVGAIRDDLLLADSTRKQPGGGAIGSGEEGVWWDSSKAA